jgi:hypothetical protein
MGKKVIQQFIKTLGKYQSVMIYFVRDNNLHAEYKLIPFPSEVIEENIQTFLFLLKVKYLPNFINIKNAPYF